MKLTKHFTIKELSCPCCGECFMDQAFMEKLEAARVSADISFKVNSGYRCEAHNEEVGGSPTSSHMKGHAVDIACANDKDRYTILEALRAAGLDRIGVAKSFIHTDDDVAKNGQRVWVY